MIFDNRIGLLEASASFGCVLLVGSGDGVGWRWSWPDGMRCVESDERSLIEKASAGLGFGLVAQMNLRV